MSFSSWTNADLEWWSAYNQKQEKDARKSKEVVKILSRAINKQNIMNGRIYYLLNFSASSEFRSDCMKGLPKFVRDRLEYRKVVIHGRRGSELEEYWCHLTKKDFFDCLSVSCGGIMNIAKVYASLKADKQNVHLSDGVMKAMEQFLADALEAECNKIIGMFQRGEISKNKFDRYIDQYNITKTKLIPTIAKNWEGQKSEREKLKKELDAENELKKRKIEARIKRSEEKKQRRIDRIAKRKEYRKLKAQKKEEKQQSEQMEREAHIAQKVKKDDSEIR